MMDLSLFSVWTVQVLIGAVVLASELVPARVQFGIFHKVHLNLMPNFIFPVFFLEHLSKFDLRFFEKPNSSSEFFS